MLQSIQKNVMSFGGFGFGVLAGLSSSSSNLLGNIHDLPHFGAILALLVKAGCWVAGFYAQLETNRLLKLK